jgi:hypothetical protein
LLPPEDDTGRTTAAEQDPPPLKEQQEQDRHQSPNIIVKDDPAAAVSYQKLKDGTMLKVIDYSPPHNLRRAAVEEPKPKPPAARRKDAALPKLERTTTADHDYSYMKPAVAYQTQKMDLKSKWRNIFVPIRLLFDELKLKRARK